MIENFGNIFYLILFIINIFFLGYYGFRIVFAPKGMLTEYELDDTAIMPLRIIGTFVVPFVIVGIYLLFRDNGVEGAWIYFILGFLISLGQLLYDILQRMKIVDSDYKIKQSTLDTIISIAFVLINAILIYGLADKIYL